MSHENGFSPITQPPITREGGVPPGAARLPDGRTNADLMGAILADQQAIMRNGDPVAHAEDLLAVDVVAERMRGVSEPVSIDLPPVPVAQAPLEAGQKAPVHNMMEGSLINVSSDKPIAEAIQAERKHMGLSGHVRLFPR